MQLTSLSRHAERQVQQQHGPSWPGEAFHAQHQSSPAEQCSSRPVGHKDAGTEEENGEDVTSAASAALGAELINSPAWVMIVLDTSGDLQLCV